MRRQLRIQPRTGCAYGGNAVKKTIIYQGAKVETEAANVAEFFSSLGIDATAALVEAGGVPYAPGADLRDVALADGDELNLFNIVAGG